MSVTNRKSHTGFRLVPISMTLNAVIALILRFFPRNSTDFQADYITVVEDRPIMPVKWAQYCLPVPLLAKTPQRGLSHLVFSVLVRQK